MLFSWPLSDQGNKGNNIFGFGTQHSGILNTVVIIRYPSRAHERQVKYSVTLMPLKRYNEYIAFLAVCSVNVKNIISWQRYHHSKKRWG